METNFNQTLSQEKRESLTSLAYLLKLFLHYKQARKKEKVYAWLIVCGIMIIGIALFYLLIVKLDVIITDNQAQVQFVVYPSDSIQYTAETVTSYVANTTTTTTQAGIAQASATTD
ncbi:MAG: hypothetical protein V1709_05155, partial [Planctomycetota bacterium]